MKFLRITIAAIAISFIPAIANAQTFQAGLQVSPAISEYGLAPGESQELTITISNTSSLPEAITLVPQKLIIDEQTEISQDQLERYDASKWIAIEPSNLLLGGGDQRVVKVVVSVPRDASPGGHYATLRIRALTETNTDVKTVPEVNAIILITVTGDIKEQLKFNEKTSTPLVQFGSKNSLSVWLENIGNVHVLPRAQLAVYKDSQQLGTLVTQPSLMLPTAIREYEFDLSPLNLGYGSHELEYVVTYGSQQSVLNIPRTTTVLLPALYVLISLGSIGIVAVGVLLIRKRMAVAWRILTTRDSGHSRITALRALADRDIVANLTDTEVESILDELDAHVGRRRSRKPKAKNK